MITKNKDYDYDLECAVLGIFLLEPNSFGSCHGVVSEDCFYDPRTKIVFNAINDYWKQGGQIDLLIIKRKMNDTGITHLGNDNLAYYLTGLTLGVVQSAHIETWCLFLRELAAKRIMIEITTSGLSKEDDIFQNAESLNAKLRKALEIKATNDWIDIKQVTADLITQMTNAKKDGQGGIKLGYRKIDEYNAGLKGGQMVVIAARPGSGKSAIAGKMIKTMAFDGHKVGIISLEMPATDVFARMVSAESGVPFWKIDKGLTDDESTQYLINGALDRLGEASIYFSDTAKVNSHDIRAKAEKLQRKNGLDILFIDYIQLVGSDDTKNKNREAQVAEISRNIKHLAMDLMIPVVVLAQLNRQAVAGQKPELHHLRESGSLEQDPDVIMFIHRDSEAGIMTDENGDSTEGKADLLVKKWRNGKCMDVKLNFNGETMDFSDVEEDRSNMMPAFDNPHAGIKKEFSEVSINYEDQAPF